MAQPTIRASDEKATEYAPSSSSISASARESAKQQLGAGWRFKDQLAARGGEAEVFLMVNEAGEEGVLKLYAAGHEPPRELLDKIQKGDARHIIRLIKHGTVEEHIDEMRRSHYYEFMEYAKHGTLADLIRNEGGKLPAAHVREILLQLAPAIRYVNDKKGLDTVHRDLKPSNILVRSFSTLDLVLSDFGVARFLDDHTEIYTTVARTMLYAAPETNFNNASPRSDLWSLGMMLVEMLRGEHPLAKVAPPLIPHRLHTRDVELFVEGVEEPWRLLCRGLLRRNPANRWTHDQVQLWIDGSTKLTVTDESAPPPPRHRAYYWPEIEKSYRTPQELSRAMSQSWGEARMLIDRHWRNLVEWAHDGAPDTRMQAAFDEIEHIRDPDERLCHTLSILDPVRTPNYCGRSLDESGLRRLAMDALAGHGEAGKAILDLRRTKVLGKFPEGGNRDFREELEMRWENETEIFNKIGAALPTDTPSEIRNLAENGRMEAYATLLLALLPKTNMAAELSYDARLAMRSPVARERWFAKLLDMPPKDNPPTKLYYIAMAAKLANRR